MARRHPLSRHRILQVRCTHFGRPLTATVLGASLAPPPFGRGADDKMCGAGAERGVARVASLGTIALPALVPLGASSGTIAPSRRHRRMAQGAMDGRCLWKVKSWAPRLGAKTGFGDIGLAYRAEASQSIRLPGRPAHSFPSMTQQGQRSGLMFQQSFSLVEAMMR